MSLEELQGRQDKQRKNSRELLVILLLLLLGICMMCIAGQAAIKLAPTFMLKADMGSGLDPNVDYALRSNPEYLEPILPGILDGPAWIDVFLTPGAAIPEDQQPSASPPTEQPPSTQEPTQDTTVPTVSTDNPQPTVEPTTVVVVPPQPPPKPKPTEPPPQPPANVQVNLHITNSDGQPTYSAGSTVIYTIIVTNNSANGIVGAVIQDDLPAQVNSWSWVCIAVINASGCDNGVPGSSSNFTDTVNIQAGGSIQYEVTATIKSIVSNDLVNLVTISVPSGYVDTDLNDNSATDTDTLVVVLPEADLAITKTDDIPLGYTPGVSITYTITVTNKGPGNASGFDIIDDVPISINISSVNCTVSGTANCGTNNTAGNYVSFTGASINSGVNNLTITVAGTVAIGTAGPIYNIASIDTSGSTTFTDSITGNNLSLETTLPAGASICPPLVAQQTVVPPGGCMLIQPASGINGNLYTISSSAPGGSLNFLWFGLNENQVSGTCGFINATLGLGIGSSLDNIAVASFSGNTILTISNSTGNSITLDIIETPWDTGGCN